MGQETRSASFRLFFVYQSTNFLAILVAMPTGGGGYGYLHIYRCHGAGAHAQHIGCTHHATATLQQAEILLERADSLITRCSFCMNVLINILIYSKYQVNDFVCVTTSFD